MDEKWRDTQFIIKNRKNGDIQDLTVNGGYLDNYGTVSRNNERRSNVQNSDGKVGNLQVGDFSRITSNGTIEHASLRGEMLNSTGGVLKFVRLSCAGSSLTNYGTINDATLSNGSFQNGSIKEVGLKIQKINGNIDSLTVTNSVMTNVCGNIDECKMTGDQMTNDLDGVVTTVDIRAGKFVNSGSIGEFALRGGTFDNSYGYIDTLCRAGGTITAEGNIGLIIDMRGAAVGVDVE
ncbi:MAG: hypothetical protein FWG73_01125 [Planctomycetaceae bacterium]|nr:hypothetical protein [Planctomycetaceae bacterium]